MLQDFTDISSISESQLTEEEALQLADELSGKLSEGEIPKSDAESLKPVSYTHLTLPTKA